ncbi:MAG: InlB B-repeat-containing protein, partial [Clostridia bacterium]|nr:InlB B-repeat-containing protein [Clostridia bacterium]
MRNSVFSKIVTIVVMLAMILSMAPTSFAAQTQTQAQIFEDFPTGWSQDAVSAAVNNGLLQGRTPTRLEPKGNLTRAEMATIINRAFGAKIEADISSYHDVNITEWYYHEIAKAVNMQTFYGDGNGRMRPNDFITREEIFAVIARALVLESDNYSSLDKFSDGSLVSGWALPYASVLVEKGYVNGNDLGMLCPKDNITREEFAQIMHNIVKTYFTESGTYGETGPDSTLIRESGVTLENMTIEGDLILGDGVGNGTVNLNNVTIKGRLLCRGGENAVKLTNTTVGEMVVVKDVNGIVHFENYRDEAPFKGIVEITPATFLTRPTGGGSFSGGGGSSTTKYTVKIIGAGEDSKKSVNKGDKYTYPTPESTGYPEFAGWLVDGEIVEPGTKVTVKSDITAEAVYWYTVEHYYQKSDLSDSYEIDESKTTKAYAKKDIEISGEVSDAQYYVYNEAKSLETSKITISETDKNTIKLYYDRQKAEITFNLDGGSATGFEKINVPAGIPYELPNGDGITKDGYTFSHWEVNGKSYFPGTFVDVNDESPISVKAVYIENGKSSYIIQHYKQEVGKASGDTKSYIPVDTDIVDEIYVGAIVSAQNFVKDGKNTSSENYDANYAGFIFNEGMKDDFEGAVVEGSVLVLKIYYDRINVSVVFDTKGGSPITQKEIQYGAELKLPGTEDTHYSGKTLVGWKDTDGNTYVPGQTVTVTNPEGTSFEAMWNDVPPAPIEKTYYKVEHYHLDANKTAGVAANYSVVETEVFTDCEVGTTVYATAKSHTGFKVSTAITSVTSGDVLTNGGLVLKIYYDREIVDISFDTNGGTPGIDPKTAGYGCSFTLPGIGSTQIDGKTLVGWKDKDGVIYPVGSTVTVESTDDINFVAEWDDNPVIPTPVAGYRVEHWQLKVGGTNGNESDYVCADTETYNNVEVGTTVNATEKSYTGFKKSEAITSVTSGTVTADGNLVLKVYYDRITVDVSYNENGGSTVADTSVQYGSQLTLPGEDSTTKDGFVLVGWTYNGTTYVPGSTITVDVVSKTEIKAVWDDAPVPSTSYKVEHWQLKADAQDGIETNYVLVEETVVNGVLVGDSVTASEKTYIGFKVNDTLSKKSGTVIDNDGLVLKIYYDRVDVSVTYNENGGTPEQTDVSVGFGNTVALPLDNLISRDGHTFGGWKDANGVVYPGGYGYKVASTAALEFTAVWNKIPIIYSGYKVEHYHLDANKVAGNEDNYSVAETEVFTDIEVGTVVNATAKSYTGFEVSTAITSVTSGNVEANNALVLKIYYDRISVGVTFDTNGGTPAIDAASVAYGNSLTLPDATSTAIDGKTLKGWEGTDGVIYPIGSTLTVNSTEPVEYKAVWEDIIIPPDPVANYKVEYYQLKVGGTNGTASDYIIVETEYFYGVTVGKEVSASDRTYAGFAKSSAISPIESGTVAADNSTVLKIYYDRVDVSVIYDENGGTFVSDTTVQYGNALTLPDNTSTTKDGFVLVGWEVDGTTYVPGSTVIIESTSEVNVKAVWDDAPIPSTYYTVEYYQLKANSAAGNEANYKLVETVTVVDVLVGSSATAQIKVYDGFEKSTAIESVETGTVLANGALVLKVYYDRQIFNVTYNENGGTPDMTDTTVAYGNTVILPEETDISKSGFVFSGWQDADGVIYPGGYEFTAFKTQNYVFTAYWTEEDIAPEKYTVTYKVNGEVVHTAEVIVGSVIPAYTYTAPEGHSFTGWDPEVPAIMPAENLEFNGTTTANKYTVTYKVNGEVVHTEEVVYGKAIPAYTYTASEGYTFSGWDAEVPSIMPASNLEFNGTTTANKYTVTYKVNGEVVHTEEVVYGEAIPAYTYTAPEGYTLSAWDKEIPATMPAENLEFNATLVGESAKLVFGEALTHAGEEATVDVKYETTIPANIVGVGKVTVPAELGEVVGFEFSQEAKDAGLNIGLSNFDPASKSIVVLFDNAVTFNGVLGTLKIKVADGAVAGDYEVSATTFTVKNEDSTLGITTEITNGKVTVEYVAPAKYTVTYKVNGEVVHSEEVVYGEAIPAYTYTTPEGHTFSGWDAEVPTTMPAE